MEISNANASLKHINFLSETECRSIEEAVAKELHQEGKSKSRSRSRSILKNKMMPSGSNQNLRIMTYRELR